MAWSTGAGSNHNPRGRREHRVGEGADHDPHAGRHAGRARRDRHVRPGRPRPHLSLVVLRRSRQRRAWSAGLRRPADTGRGWRDARRRRHSVGDRRADRGSRRPRDDRWCDVAEAPRPRCTMPGIAHVILEVTDNGTPYAHQLPAHHPAQSGGDPLTIVRATRQPMARALLFLLAWTVIGTVSFARRALDDPGRTMGGQPLWAYAEWLTCYLPWGLLSVGLFALERRFPLGRARAAQPGRARAREPAGVVRRLAPDGGPRNAGLGHDRPPVALAVGVVDHPARGSPRPRAPLLGHDRRGGRASHDAGGARERATGSAAPPRHLAARDQPAPGRARRVADAPAAALPVQQPAEHLGAGAPRSRGRQPHADAGSAICCARRWRATARPRRRSRARSR